MNNAWKALTKNDLREVLVRCSLGRSRDSGSTAGSGRTGPGGPCPLRTTSADFFTGERSGRVSAATGMGQRRATGHRMTCMDTDTLFIAQEATPQPADLLLLDDALTRSNIAAGGPPRDYAALTFFLRGTQGELCGGLYGATVWRWLCIRHLWVVEQCRGQGWGRALMAAAERAAVSRGCLHSHVDTFSFQALPFYCKLGYTVFGTLEDFPPGHSRYFLQKRNLAGGPPEEQLR